MNEKKKPLHGGWKCRSIAKAQKDKLFSAFHAESGKSQENIFPHNNGKMCMRKRDEK